MPHLKLVVVNPGPPPILLPEPVLPGKQNAAGVSMLTSKSILSTPCHADGFAKLTDISMVGHILHGEAAGPAAATVGDPLDLNEIRLTQVQQGSIVGDLIHIPAFHQCQPA